MHSRIVRHSPIWFLMLTFQASSVLGDVVMTTGFPQPSLVADGITVHQLEVRASTMQHPGVRFVGGQWDVSFPPYLTVVGAEMPNPNAPPGGPSTNPDDFFYPQLPDWNGLMWADRNMLSPGPYPFAGGGVLSWNVRLSDTLNGPANVHNKLLGRHSVTVNLGTTPQTGNCDLPSNVAFFDTTFMEWNYPWNGAGVIEIQNQSFRIMPRKGDINGDGLINASDIGAFLEALLGSPTLQTGEGFEGEYCDWSGNADGTIDGRDLQGFVTSYLANGR